MLIRKGYVLMKKEIKGFVCGVLSTVVVEMDETSATAATENIPAF